MRVRQPSFRGARIAPAALLGCASALAIAACTYSLADVRPSPGAVTDGSFAEDGGDARIDAGKDSAVAADGSGDAPLTNGCPTDANVGAYVVTQSSLLYSFQPPATFALVGQVDCDAGQPWDMAVAQDGTAWMVFQNGGVFKVSTSDARCTSTGYVPDQQGFLLFAMAFGRTSPSTETLYVSDTTYRLTPPPAGHSVSAGMATIDTTSLTLTPVGKFLGAAAPLGAELTGTMDQRLFGFFPQDDAGDPAKIAELLVEDAGVLLTLAGSPLTGLTVPANGDFAFLVWRGDFWLFTADAGAPSTVWHYSPTSNPPLTMMDAGAPGAIIGAGVSTCARP
jgi:hypothetical protein